jgi:hypothetical protein
VRFEGLTERLQVKFAADAVNVESFVAQLRQVIRTTVRRTDLVSDVDRDLIGLLLSETPASGADVVANRLNDSLYTFLRQSGQHTSGLSIKIDIGSFPGNDGMPVEKLLEEFFR